MTSTIQIQDFRVSFIWFETLLSFLGNKVPDPAHAPFNFLGRDDTYMQKFDDIKQGHDVATKLTPPWKDKSKQRFWFYYLERHPSKDVTAMQAWKGFVPFRGKVPFNKVTTPLLPEPKSFFLETFYYPHGMAVVATARCRNDFTLGKAVELAMQIRRDARFEVEIQGEAPDSFSLDELAEKAFDLLRVQAWGTDTPAGPRTDPPFTIFTVVQGSGVDPSMAIPANGEIHRALEAVTRWQVNKYGIPTKLEEANLLAIRQASSNRPLSHLPPPSHVLYATEKGRAVWFPETFMPGGKLSTLACYHRNLVFATLQVESLCGLASESANQPDVPDSLPETQSECLKRAALTLGRLYGGAKLGTYSTWSARHQIDKNEMVPVVNKVRSFWGLDPLF